MFAYCNNNPAMNTDITGMHPSGLGHAAIYVRDEALPLVVDDYAYYVGYTASITKDHISIDLESVNSELYTYCEVTGVSLLEACQRMADGVCDRYYQNYNEEFLLSNACVANEIFEHILAYRWAIGERNTPTLLGLGYRAIKGSKEAVAIACVRIDIRVSEICIGGPTSQSFVFGYRNGIRECYRGTERDPWANKR